MDNEKVIQNWVSLSDYDIESAQVMLDSKRFLYVAFMCQQAIEKLLKACFVKEKGKTPPYTHSLVRLCEELSFYSVINEKYQEDIELLNSYYIASRYSEDYAELSKSISLEQANDMFEFSQEFLEWLKSQMI